MKESPPAELGELCRHAAGLVRELRESRWAGLTHLRGEAAATSPPRVEPAGREKAPPSRAAGSLDEIRLRVESCTKCPLHETRKKTVFGEGAPSADLLFVGEGPGAEEDRQGRPFVGAAGQGAAEGHRASANERSIPLGDRGGQTDREHGGFIVSHRDCLRAVGHVTPIPGRHATIRK